MALGPVGHELPDAESPFPRNRLSRQTMPAGFRKGDFGDVHRHERRAEGFQVTECGEPTGPLRVSTTGKGCGDCRYLPLSILQIYSFFHHPANLPVKFRIPRIALRLDLAHVGLVTGNPE